MMPKKHRIREETKQVQQKQLQDYYIHLFMPLYFPNHLILQHATLRSSLPIPTLFAANLLRKQKSSAKRSM